MCTLLKHLDYRRATKLREIRRMRHQLFREVNRFQLIYHRTHEDGFAYEITYFGRALPEHPMKTAEEALTTLFSLRTWAYTLGIIRIQQMTKDL